MGKIERRTFSDEFKEHAVLRADVGGRAFTQVARKIGIHLSLVQTWRRKYGHDAAIEAEKAVISSPRRRDTTPSARERSAALCEGIPMRYAFIKKQRAWHCVRRMCELLEISPAGYYY